MTYQEKLVAGLLALGYVENKASKSKYREFFASGVPLRLFVGKYGALRKGECASRSFSLGDPQNQSKVWLSVIKKGEEHAKG